MKPMKVMLLSSAFWSSAVMAQDAVPADGDAGALQEIVVTAQKREASAQDVPISIAVLGGSELSSRGITDTVALVKAVPGLAAVITSGYSGKVNYTLRGIGLNNFSETQEAAVAVYQDEVYIAPAIGAAFSMYDTNRVEVLRGPQGTVFGRSASGGLVHFLSQTPSERSEGYLTVGLGAFGSRVAEAAINAPLGESAALRVSGRYEGNDGWIRNSQGDSLESGDSYSGRAQLKLEPTDSLVVLLKAEYGKFESNSATGYVHIPAAVDANGVVRRIGPNENVYGVPGADLLGYRDRDGKFFEVASDTPGRNDLERTLLTGRVTWDLGGVTLTSVTGYLDVKKDYFEDTDASPNAYINVFIDNHSQQFQQELRLSGESERLRWLAGAFYFDYDVAFDLRLRLPTGIAPLGVPPLGTDNLARQSKSSLAGFGQVSYDLTDEISVQIGGRVEREKVDFSYVQSFNPLGVGIAVLGSAPMNFTPQTAGDLARIRQTYGSGDLTMNYRPSDDLLAYVSVRRGIKPGGFNTPLAPLAPQNMRFNAEKLDAVEAGFKSDLFDRRLRLNASVYHYWYNNYQAVQFRGAGTFTTNADARIIGADFEMQWAATRNWTLGVNGGVLDSTVKDIALRGSAGVTVRDRELPNAPKLSINGFVQYQTEAFGGDLRLRADASYRSKTFFELQNHPANVQDAFALIDLGAVWKDGPIEIGVSVNNLFDKEYFAYITDISDFTFLAANPGRRRWASGHVTFRW
ncbi:MAG: TonB-dependent receptor [Blastomonas sp.]|jgi:iron complex outermembrane receptor protein|uniref:TonB-dependent receptor n=1 Tax=Blastomonas sp. TaxID=1909299 RepID=UPI0025882678|nr:TonB-dependent receptor [Blastomonas sp.]MCO5792547.1 TonB-dependent receptor [Blastomonas sp.]